MYPKATMQVLILFTLIHFTYCPLRAQSTSTEPVKESGTENSYSKNVIKTNLFSPVLRCASIQYERGLNKNFSGGITLTRIFERNFDPISFLGEPPLFNLRLSGWAITPEIRFYPGRKESKKAPHGFYISLYSRISNFSFTEKFLFNVVDVATGLGTIIQVSADSRFDYQSIAPGLMMGYQWIISRHFSIDWWIMGFHAGRARLKGKFESEAIGRYPDDFRQAYEEIDFSLFSAKPEIQITGNTGAFQFSGLPFAGLRTGLCLGVAF